VRPVDCSHS